LIGSLLALALLTVLGDATADIVLLNNGNRFEGEVTEKGDTVEVKMANGATFPIPRSQVKKIIRRKLPEEQLAERKAKLDEDDANAVFAFAQWCRANGFNEEGEKYLRAVLAIEPEHAEAKEALYTYRKTYKKIPANKQAQAKLEREFGPSFRITRTKHFRICHNTETAFTDHRAGLFELVYRTFYGFFEERNFPLTTLNDRFEVVLFESREQFQRYASRENPTLESSAGYYSPMKNRVAFYNSLNDPNLQRQKQMILAAERRVQEMRRQLARTKARTFRFTFPDGSVKTLSRSQTMSFLAREERKIRDQRRKLSGFYKKENVTTTVHECLHQLAFNLGLQKMTGDCPKWVGEGLATYFETATAGSLAQVGKINAQRHDIFRKARQAGALIPLELLVSRDEVFIVSSPTALAAYAQAWGLTHYMLSKKEDAFLKYLIALGNKKLRAMPTADERLRDFMAYFTRDLPAFEKQWLAYMDSLR